MARNVDPFTPHGHVDREQLERYVQGLLSPAECHAVELHLERDPLLRDAAEGLRMPGAVEAFHQLPGPATGTGTGPWVAGVLSVGIVLGIILHALWPSPPADGTSPPGPQGAMTHALTPAAIESTLQVVHLELAAVPAPPAQPEERPLPQENFRREPAVPGNAERESPERMEVQPVQIDRGPGQPAALRPARGTRPSRHLVFLHGLKVVHPSELARAGLGVQGSPGRSADAEQARRDQVPPGPVTRPYLDLMDEALGAFARNAYRPALDELYFLLGQNPEDVNAQFYAGLACYRLGLDPRAARLFRAAARNPVDSFHEEAEWYGALAMERMEGRAAARPALERIAQGGGFYAARAQELLRH